MFGKALKVLKNHQLGIEIQQIVDSQLEDWVTTAQVDCLRVELTAKLSGKRLDSKRILNIHIRDMDASQYVESF